MDRNDRENEQRTESAKTREGGGGSPVPADDPLDRSVSGEDAAEQATPPTEGPAAAGSLPG